MSARLNHNAETKSASSELSEVTPVPRKQWKEYIQNIHPIIPFKNNAVVDDYLEGATLIVSVVENPFLLQDTISFFNKNLESAHRLKLGTFDHWERFYKLSVERLGHQDKSSDLLQELLDCWAIRMQPEGCDLKEARALLACRRARQNASLRFQAETMALGHIKQKYLEGADEVQRLAKAGVLSPEDIKLYTESQAILLGRAWELSRSYALRGWKVGLHGQSGHNSCMVDLINQRPGANPLWLRLREPTRDKCLTTDQIRRECNSDDLGDYWWSDSLLSLSAWLKETTRAESFVDFVTKNACVIKVGSDRNRYKTDFISQQCHHGESCGGYCLDLRRILNERVKDIAEKRQKMTPEGVAYMVCVRPKAFDKLFYVSRPCGFFTRGPLERAPNASEILEKGPPGVERIYSIPRSCSAHITKTTTA